MTDRHADQVEKPSDESNAEALRMIDASDVIEAGVEGIMNNPPEGLEGSIEVRFHPREQD